MKNKFEYYGEIEVILDSITMQKITLPFVFQHKHMLTRDKVKQNALDSLHEQSSVLGIDSITYKWRLL